VTNALSEPLKDIKGKVLVAAGVDVLEWSKKTPLTGEYLKKKQKFKDNVQLIEDLNSLLVTPPYDKILQGWTTDMREWIGEIWAPSAVFDELKFQRMRDPYSYRHVLTVAVVGSRLIEFWIKTPPTLKKTFMAFLFHDLGKTRVAPTILDKTEDLSELERRSLLEHPLASFALNAAYWGDANHMCADVGLHHQEDRLGQGYPRGVKTNSLVLDVLRLVDRFDALISERPFRFKKYSPREALDVLKKDADEGRMEADVLRALVSLVRKEPVTDLKKIKLGTAGRKAKGA
jgi:HD-GYP domain-containing protein (c-di-GMP phosphodiesterase class II)